MHTVVYIMYNTAEHIHLHCIVQRKTNYNYITASYSDHLAHVNLREHWVIYVGGAVASWLEILLVALCHRNRR